MPLAKCLNRYFFFNTQLIERVNSCISGKIFTQIKLRVCPVASVFLMVEHYFFVD